MKLRSAAVLLSIAGCVKAATPESQRHAVAGGGTGAPGGSTFNNAAATGAGTGTGAGTEAGAGIGAGTGTGAGTGMAGGLPISSGTASGGTGLGSGTLGPGPGAAGGNNGEPGSLCGGDVLFCDDFDTYAAGANAGKAWTASVNNNGHVAVDGSKAHSGKQSLKVDVPASSYSRAYLEVKGSPVFPAAGDAFYGRMFIYLDSVPSGPVHWTIISGEGLLRSRNVQTMVRYGGQNDGKILANYYTQDNAADCWGHSSESFPMGQWSCVEWFFDGAHNGMNLWIDGRQIPSATVLGRPTMPGPGGQGCPGSWSGDWLGPAYDKLHVGWEHYQQTEGRQMWLDDLAVGPTRIGCAPR